MNRKSERSYPDALSLIPPVLLCGIPVTVNTVFYPVPVAVLAASLAGSLFYVLFGLTAWCDDSRMLDTVQSGRTGQLTVLVFFTAILGGGHPAIAIPVVLAGAVAAEFYLHRLLRADAVEMSFYGLFVNTTMVLAFFLYRVKVPQSGTDQITAVLSPVIPASSSHPAAGAALLLPGAAVLCLIVLARPEMSALALGESFFSRTGFSYRFWYGLVLALRGVFMALTFLLLGWMQGVVLPSAGSRLKNRGLSAIKFLLLCIAYTQGLMALSRWFNPPLVVITSIFISTFSYIFRYGRTGVRYGYR